MIIEEVENKVEDKRQEANNPVKIERSSLG